MSPLAANYTLIYLLTDDNWWLGGQSQHGHLRCGHLLFIKDFIRVYLNKFQQMYTNQSALDNMMLGFVKRRKGQAPAKESNKQIIIFVKSKICFQLWTWGLLFLRSDFPGVLVRLVSSGPIRRERGGEY